MVTDHSDSEKGNPLPPHGLLFPISSKGSFICTIPTDRIPHTTAFVTPVVEHWVKREIAQWVHPMKDRSDDPSHHERRLLPRSYISLPVTQMLILQLYKSSFLEKILQIEFLILQANELIWINILLVWVRSKLKN